MTGQDLRKKFLDFFESKAHKVVSSSSLVPPPEDTSIILANAGMNQFKPYFAGKKDVTQDFGIPNLASAQKCFRTSDIDEVGDLSHLTFFEMLGNFSIGGYGKKEAIEYAWELMTSSEWFGLPKDRFFVTVFAGDSEVPADKESEDIWKNTDAGIEVKKFGRDDNFWPNPIWVGTCGPSSELHYKLDEGSLEIWNLVFTQYYHHGEGRFEDLGKVNIDTGMGLERLAMIVQNKPSVFETDLFWPIIEKIVELTGRKYGKEDGIDKSIRIVADHIRSATFLIADGVTPSNKERGYILRRMIRRSVTHLKILNEDFKDLNQLSRVVIESYKEAYPELITARMNVLTDEEDKFKKTLHQGLKEYQKMDQEISGEQAFLLFSSFGFPIELTEELAKIDGKEVDKEGFEDEFKKHQELSRKA